MRRPPGWRPLTVLHELVCVLLVIGYGLILVLTYIGSAYLIIPLHVFGPVAVGPLDVLDVSYSLLLMGQVTWALLIPFPFTYSDDNNFVTFFWFT